MYHRSGFLETGAVESCLQKRYQGMLSRDPPGKEVRGELH